MNSPTVSSPRNFDLILNSPLQLAIAPIATIIGFGVPSLVMALPAPSVISIDSKQTWTAIQQGWPIWIALVQTIMTALLSIANPMVSVLTEEDKRAKTLKYMRRAYAFALTSSAGAHLTICGASLMAYAFPSMFTEPYRSQLQPSNLLLPIVPFGPRQAHTLADGALWFLQWDLIIGVISVLLWGSTLRTTANKDTGIMRLFVNFFKSAILTVCVGPSGAAVVAVWGRDEVVLGRSTMKQVKMT